MKNILSQSPRHWEQALHRRAASQFGTDEFGDPAYLEAMRRLLSAYENDDSLNALARVRIYSLLGAMLASRLSSARGWKQNPGCLDSRIDRPIFITGLPRTGSTALHKLLAVDGRFQGIEHWLLHSPQPRPPRDSWEANLGYSSARKNLEEIYQRSPQLRMIHEQVASEVDECATLTAQMFASNMFGSLSRIPSYDDWFLRQDLTPAYRRFADNLRLIGSSSTGRRWLLKDPSHLLSLEALLAVFPDAVVVQTHRHPGKVIPSICSLYAKCRTYFEGGCSDPAYIGARELKLWTEAVKRSASTEGDSRVHHVDYSDFVGDPLSTVVGIYQACGIEMTPEVQSGMVRWLQGNPKNKHGAHRYQAHDFGLNEQQIETEFADYIDRFALAESSSRAVLPLARNERRSQGGHASG